MTHYRYSSSLALSHMINCLLLWNPSWTSCILLAILHVSHERGTSCNVIPHGKCVLPAIQNFPNCIYALLIHCSYFMMQTILYFVCSLYTAYIILTLKWNPLQHYSIKRWILQCFALSWSPVFVSTNLQVFKIRNSIQGTVPVRALLCSYKCFNAEGHSYYGVAFPWNSADWLGFGIGDIDCDKGHPTGSCVSSLNTLGPLVMSYFC